MLNILIPVTELYARVTGDAPPVLIDVRFNSRRDDHRSRYEAGHIPGAHFADTLKDLSALPAGERGLRPLPSLPELEGTIRRWGISRDTDVVVYDDRKGLTAGRALWILTWTGVQNVRLLDGGYQAWTDAGYPVSTDIPAAPPSSFKIEPGHLPQIDLPDIDAFLRKGILVDVRTNSEYSGTETLPNMPVGGHIPGAINLPMEGGITQEGLHAHPDDVRARYAAIGVDGSRPVAIYCGAGGGAAHEVMVLRALGIEASLFVGSWSAWSADPRRPIALGDEPGAAP